MFLLFLAAAGFGFAVRQPNQTQNEDGRTVQQKIECFDGAGGQGLSQVFADAITDLGKYSFDEKISSCCVTGTWILYTDADFNTGNQGAAMYWTYGDNTCLDIPDDFNNQASSLRFAGSRADWCFPSINIYSGPYFSGESNWYFKDTSNLGSIPAQSLIVNSGSAWTIYEGENYQGRAVCVYPKEGGNCLPEVYFDYFVIGSIRRGCSEEVIKDHY